MPDRSYLPDFIIGGAPRSGTTFLCHALARHPGIFVAKPFIPEPKVFLGPERSPEAYRLRLREFFADAAPGQRLVEKTSYYLESAEACSRIRAVVPHARLVFIIREPVARAYSNYLWTRQNGFETLSFVEAVEQETTRPDPMPPERSYVRPYAYLARGDYATFLERYYAAFGRDSVAVYLYEDIIERPGALLDAIQRWIGVDALPLERLYPGVVNAMDEPGPPLDRDLELELRARMQPMVRRLRDLCRLDLTSWGYAT
jgi:hypothetical protein